jgi:peptidoglycan/xylan/chitin deacetylase (PgdA/CDA1 family)
MKDQRRKKIYRSMQEVPLELSRFYRREYPRFVWESSPPQLRDEVPVFMFHRVFPDDFARQMEFLKRNGYQTLTLQAFVNFLCGKERLRGPSVLLTFDDGDQSLYTAAYPLLKKYGFHAAAFVIPYYVYEVPHVLPGRGMISWPELREMQQSGVIDVQSHSYRHDRIFTSPRLVDFYHPGYDPNPLRIDLPWFTSHGRYTNRLEWGAPIYTTASRYAAPPRFFDDPVLRRTLIDWVSMHGEEDFFRRPGWRRELKSIFRLGMRDQRASHFESGAEQAAAILDDLTRARDVIEEKLGTPARHLCLPRGEGSPLTTRLSQQLGYESIFWVTHPGKRLNRAGDSPFTVTRLKDDYLLRLPGEQRQPLFEIFRSKLARRAATLDLY